MEWVVNVMSRPISPEKDPVSGWVSELVWTGVENLAPTRFRSPDRPARSESLYRLSYPGSYIYICVCVCVCVHMDTETAQSLWQQSHYVRARTAKRKIFYFWHRNDRFSLNQSVRTDSGFYLAFCLVSIGNLCCGRLVKLTNHSV